jgi:phosphate starvation-inducible PhoH-like protein
VQRTEEVFNRLRDVIRRDGVIAEDAVTRALTQQLVPGEISAGAAIDLFEKAKKVRPRTPGQQRYVDEVRKNDLVFCLGPAGCGKTYLAVAMAVNALRSEQVRRIVLVRPAVEAGEKLGFLPGDLLAKVNPFLRPLLDAMNDMLNFEQVRLYMENDVVEIVPLAFMRGRTLNDTFIILDEAQNTTITQMKMFLTRMGEGSKIVVTGDATQSDLPENVASGFNDAMSRLNRIEGVAIVTLTGEDIVRHRLVREIVKAYDQGPSRGSHT